MPVSGGGIPSGARLVSGFVLVGGKSSRMGRDKALLSWNGTTLAQHVARTVAEATGSAVLIGDPLRYGELGYPVVPDDAPGLGPVGGIATALRRTKTEWALIAACDMPHLTVDVLKRLLDETARTDRLCVAPAGPSGPEPLCAVYHRSTLATLERAISDARHTMREIVSELDARLVPGIDAGCLANLNTPEDIHALAER